LLQRMSIAALLLSLIALAGCSASEDKGVAETAVAQFHERLNSGAFKDIYATTDAKFREVTSEADFLALLDAIHRKLGAQQSKSVQSWRVNWTNEGTLVFLSYDTQYAEGKATEQFVWRAIAGHIALVSYKINSQTLILK